MLQEDAMYIGTQADVSGHVLDISGKKTQLCGLLDTGAVLSVIPIETWNRLGFDKDDLIDSRTRLSAANKGALRVLGRTPIIALNLGECNLWMSFLVVENLDKSDQFILGRDFIRNFDVAIDLNNAMFRIWNPQRKYVIKPVNLIMANKNKAPVFLSRMVSLKANEVAIVSLRMKNYNELSDNEQVCIVPNPNASLPPPCESAVPHREGVRRMTPNKSDACRKEIETLLEYDMIELSKSPWACGVVMAKKKGDQLKFCSDFRYLISVTVKDAYPIPRIDQSLSKLGDAKFFYLIFYLTLNLFSAF